MTTQDSYYLSKAVSAEHTSLDTLKELFDSLPITVNSCSSTEKPVLLTICEETQRRHLKFGRCYVEKANCSLLHEKLMSNLCSNITTVVPSFAMPLSDSNDNAHHYLHLQFDVDRASNVDCDEIALRSENEQRSFYQLWVSFLKQLCPLIRTRDVVCTRSPLTTGGVHVFVKNWKATVSSFRTAIILARQHLQDKLNVFNLTIDNHSALFLSGCHRSGEKSKVYRNFDGSDCLNMPFPICTCSSLCKDFSITKNINMRFDGTSVSTNSRSFRSRSNFGGEAARNRKTSSKTSKSHAEVNRCTSRANYFDTHEPNDRISKGNSRRALSYAQCVSSVSSVSLAREKRFSSTVTSVNLIIKSRDKEVQSVSVRKYQHSFEPKSRHSYRSLPSKPLAESCIRAVSVAHFRTVSDTDKRLCIDTSRCSADAVCVEDSAQHFSLNRGKQVAQQKRNKGSIRTASCKSESIKSYEDPCYSHTPSKNRRENEDSEVSYGPQAGAAKNIARHTWGDKGIREFSMEKVIAKSQTGQNVVCLKTHKFLLDVMFIQSQKALNDTHFSIRYTIEYVATALTTYAKCIWRDFRSAREYPLGVETFCRELIKMEIRRAEERIMVDLHCFTTRLMLLVSPNLQICESLLTESSPSLTEAIFTILHIGLWSLHSAEEYGLPSVSGNYVAYSSMCVAVAREMLSAPHLFEVPTHSEPAMTTKSSDYAQAVQSVTSGCRASSRVDETTLTIMFLVAIAHPFDGQNAWNCARLPFWQAKSEVEFQHETLKLLLATLEKVVGEFDDTSLPTKPIKQGCETFQKRKLGITEKDLVKHVVHVWRTPQSAQIIPSGLLMTSDNRIFSLEGLVEVRNIPCYRYRSFHSTGYCSDTLKRVALSPLPSLNLFVEIAQAQKSLPEGAYISYPYGNVQFDKGFQGESQIASPRLILPLADPRKQSELAFTALIELLNIRGAAHLCCVCRDIITEKRKKVVMCYSEQPNHGKTTTCKAISKLFGNSSHSIGFSTISQKAEGSLINPALVQASGKMVASVDEIPAGNSVKDASSVLSMSRVKMMTGNTSAASVRELYATSRVLSFNLTLFTFSNSLPRISSTLSADIERLHFLRFPRQFQPHSNSLEQKIGHIKIALETVSLALEYAYKRARDGCEESLAALESFYNVSMLSPLPFALSFFDQEISQKCSPNYDECIKKYRPEEDIVNEFANVTGSSLTSNTVSWKAVGERFKAFVKSQYRHSVENIPKMLTMLQKVYKAMKINVAD